MIHCSDLLAEKYPGLTAAMWQATFLGESVGDLPSLMAIASENTEAQRRATNMTAFFRELGAKGRSPVEFQIEKAQDGTLAYSRRNILVDYLLYTEVWSGFLIGFHDREALGENLVYGLAKEADAPSFEHISRKTVTMRPDEPALIANGRIVASLRHGPDFATRVHDKTTSLWGVLFAAPSDRRDTVERVMAMICDDGVTRGVWSLGTVG